MGHGLTGSIVYTSTPPPPQKRTKKRTRKTKRRALLPGFQTQRDEALMKQGTMKVALRAYPLFVGKPKFCVTPPKLRLHLPLPFLLPIPVTVKLATILNPPETLRCRPSPSHFLTRCRGTMATDALTVHVKDKIDLTDKETLIFNRLKEVLRHFNLNTQLRVAGGWVRDKVSLPYLLLTNQKRC